MVYVVIAIIAVLLLPFAALFCVYIGSVLIDAIIAAVESYIAAWKEVIDIIFNRGE